jgi:hypothetical protein
MWALGNYHFITLTDYLEVASGRNFMNQFWMFIQYPEQIYHRSDWQFLSDEHYQFRW